jgi:hypothetical protein
MFCLGKREGIPELADKMPELFYKTGYFSHIT